MSYYQLFDPLLAPEDAERMVNICASYGPHGMYSEEALNEGIGEKLPQRYDAVLNYLESHKDLPSDDNEIKRIARRTNYFRETYAYGDEILAPGIEPFLRSEKLIEAAQQVHDRPVIEPAIVFANLFLPGQELAVHTDVPEFRGANRKVLPQWLLVAMHHSGLFEDWRMPIATCVSWYHDSDGGEFVFYPEGATANPVIHTIKSNTAVIVDTDSIFHGVGRMKEGSQELPELQRGMTIAPEGNGNWNVIDGHQTVASYTWNDMRLSVSWKAYCFRDQAEHALWQTQSDDLTLDFILQMLRTELNKRDVKIDDAMQKDELAEIIIREFIRFPPAHPTLVPAAFAA